MEKFENVFGREQHPTAVEALRRDFEEIEKLLNRARAAADYLDKGDRVGFEQRIKEVMRTRGQLPVEVSESLVEAINKAASNT